jgi:site-specific recombinase XerD
MAILDERRAAVERARQKATEAKQAFDAPLFVFPAARGQGHAVGLAKAFAAVCGRAGLSGVRIHDLRHSFASFAVADGASLFLVSKLLGHANASTTERYAHLSSDPLADAVNLIGQQIMGDADDAGDADDEDNTSDGQGANVVKLKERR